MVDRVLVELKIVAIDRLQAKILEREKSEQILRSIVEGTILATVIDYKLKQVLINLVTNVCEAVSIGEAISISIHQSEVRRIYISINNCDMLISTDILPQLTKPSFTTKASETGLGLAMVKRTVEAHDGELGIDSAEGIGSIVTVELPLVLF